MHHTTRNKSVLSSLLIINFLYTLHFAIPVYANSSFLTTYLPEKFLGILYILAAIVALIFLSSIEKLIVRFGNLKTVIVLLILDAFALAVLTVVELFNLFTNPYIVVSFFIIHYAIAVFVIKFNIDIYLEAKTRESTTGTTRGKFLTSANIAWIAGPIVAGYFLSVNNGYWKIYASSFVLTIILIATLYLSLRKVKDISYNKIYFLKTIKNIIKGGDLYKIFMANFLMYFYFSWMVIFLPLYLTNHIGISWESLGLVILPIMLLPYLLLDIPLGILADRYFGEKELLSGAFVVTAIATIPIFFITTNNIFVWATILFLGRVGTATIEIMSETYFFKKIDAKDGNILSVFRDASPLAYIFGPLIASLLLLIPFIDIGHLFLILGIVMFFGLWYSLNIRDTN